jgi:hypothetical protein
LSQSTPLSREQERRNYSLGIANGALIRLFSALTDTSLVLAWFVSQLGGSALIVGLLVPIANGGWFLPQLWMLRFVRRHPRNVPFYRAVSVARTVAWVLLTLLVFALGSSRPRTLLVAFMLLYALFSLGAGISGLSFMDVTGKVIPLGQRGSYFALREFIGGVLALGGSVLARYVLDARHGLAFPYNFGWLIALGGAAAAAGFLSFGLIVEPAEEHATHQAANQAGGQSVVSVLRRDRSYLMFVLGRMFSLVGISATPFYSIFAKDVLHAPVEMAGVYLAATTLAGVGSTLVWGRLSRRVGSRAVVWWATVLSIAMPLLPLLLGGSLSRASFTVVFLLVGATVAGTDIGFMSLVLDMAPAGERTVYVGLVNSVLGVVSLALIAEGWVVERWGLNALFAASAVCSALTLLALSQVREPVSA